MDEAGVQPAAEGEKDGAAVRFPPPFYFLIAIGVAVALHEWVLRLTALDAVPPTIRIAAGCAIGGLGLVFMVGSLAQQFRSGQNPIPWESTPSVLTGGLYRFSRNPMYVGDALTQVGIGVATGVLWIVILAVPAVILVDRFTVPAEEAYLERKFGDAYREYRQSVRRWL